jgi:SAM-dependent methyltransferase
VDLLEDAIPNPLNHWYYGRKFDLLSDLFRASHQNIKTVADIGAGSALFSKRLAELYPSIDFYAIDINYSAAQIAESNLNMHFLKETTVADFYILTDVLEHIKDDRDFLRNLVDNAAPDAKFFITVPAQMQLWSGHDVFLRHYRRYNNSQLRNLVESSNLKIYKIGYLFFLLYFPAYLIRKLPFGKKNESQMRATNPIVNTFLKILNRFEDFIPFKQVGISLFCMAQK